MKNILSILLFFISLLTTSCSTDEPNGLEIQPDKNYPDPEEITTVSLYKNTNQNLDGIYIDINDKFASTNGWLFVSLGEMNGLGNITSIPQTGWSESISVKKGYGYVAYNITRPSGFYRMFVSNSASDEMGTITGFQIKYQKPFYGSDEAITVDQTKFDLCNGGGEHIVAITNKTIIPYMIEVDCDWLTVLSSDNSYDFNSVLGYRILFRAAHTNSLNPSSGRIKIKTYFGKATTITVNREAMTPWTATTSILDLKNKYWTNELNSCQQINEDVIIRGRIVSSDKDGNIYKSLVIEDSSAALPISINQSNLYLKFPFGQEITVNLKGLYIGNYQGQQQIGDYYPGDASLTFLSPDKFKEFSQYQIIGEPTEIPPVFTTLSTLNSALAEPSELAKWQGRYIKLDNISFREQGVPLASYHLNTNHIIFDESNYQIAVRTSGYSNFWNEETPHGVGSISGILTYYKGDWQLMLNSLNDLGYFDPNSSIFPVDPEPKPEPNIPSGDGSEAYPYNVQAVIRINNPGTPAWVTGYIVGLINPNENYALEFNAPFTIASNVYIADSPSETNMANMLPVQLTYSSVIRDAINLRDNPGNLGKMVTVCGTLEKYFGQPGIKALTAYKF